MRLYKHLYGPVPSRRLGRSLGVDLVPLKTCSFDCIYCQLGRTPQTILQRKPYIPAAVLQEEIGAWVEQGGSADYITMSGSGEPTLNSDIGTVIRWTRAQTGIPVAVITNSSLLSDPAVRDDLMAADLVVPSLDAPSEPLFNYINRPHPDIVYQEMIEGLISFASEFKGVIWLEVFLVYPANTIQKDLEDLTRIVEQIPCDRIHINTTVRPPAEEYADSAPCEKLALARELMGERAEIIAAPAGASADAGAVCSVTRLLSTLQRRPCTVEDLSRSCNTSPHAVLKSLDPLVAEGTVRVERQGTNAYYQFVKE